MLTMACSILLSMATTLAPEELEEEEEQCVGYNTHDAQRKLNETLNMNKKLEGVT